MLQFTTAKAVLDEYTKLNEDVLELKSDLQMLVFDEYTNFLEANDTLITVQNLTNQLNSEIENLEGTLEVVLESPLSASPPLEPSLYETISLLSTLNSLLELPLKMRKLFLKGNFLGCVEIWMKHKKNVKTVILHIPVLSVINKFGRTMMSHIINNNIVDRLLKESISSEGLLLKLKDHLPLAKLIIEEANDEIQNEENRSLIEDEVMTIFLRLRQFLKIALASTVYGTHYHISNPIHRSALRITIVKGIERLHYQPINGSSNFSDDLLFIIKSFWLQNYESGLKQLAFDADVAVLSSSWPPELFEDHKVATALIENSLTEFIQSNKDRLLDGPIELKAMVISIVVTIFIQNFNDNDWTDDLLNSLTEQSTQHFESKIEAFVDNLWCKGILFTRLIANALGIAPNVGSLLESLMDIFLSRTFEYVIRPTESILLLTINSIDAKIKIGDRTTGSDNKLKKSLGLCKIPSVRQILDNVVYGKGPSVDHKKVIGAFRNVIPRIQNCIYDCKESNKLIEYILNRYDNAETLKEAITKTQTTEISVVESIWINKSPLIDILDGNTAILDCDDSTEKRMDYLVYKIDNMIKG